jgi:hypothetical protein
MKRLLMAALALVGLGGLVAASAKAPETGREAASTGQEASRADLIVCPITGDLIPPCCCPAGARK